MVMERPPHTPSASASRGHTEDLAIMLFWSLWSILAVLDYFGHCGLFWLFWAILDVLGYFRRLGLFELFFVY